MREKVADIWCPACRTLYAQLFREPVNETVSRHVAEPEDVPARCTRCEAVLERRRV